jgi:hypothetical protein
MMRNPECLSLLLGLRVLLILLECRTFSNLTHTNLPKEDLSRKLESLTVTHFAQTQDLIVVRLLISNLS